MLNFLLVFDVDLSNASNLLQSRYQVHSRGVISDQIGWYWTAPSSWIQAPQLLKGLPQLEAIDICLPL